VEKGVYERRYKLNEEKNYLLLRRKEVKKKEDSIWRR